LDFWFKNKPSGNPDIYYDSGLWVCRSKLGIQNADVHKTNENIKRGSFLAGEKKHSFKMKCVFVAEGDKHQCASESHF
jgi:hypothetical protein